jgi:genome maintenance exonuclease 1
MSLIKNKFIYEKLTRVEVNGKRKYETPGGTPVASVTTILGETKDKTHLIEWRKRVGEQKAQEITTEASGVGTRMHKYLEDYIDTGAWPVPGSNPYAQQAHQMASTIKTHALDDVNEIWGSEVPLYVPSLYAGTTDLVGVYKGNAAILDFKQTNKPKKGEWVEDYFLQLTAYALAHNEVHGTDIKHGHIFMCSRALEYQQFDLSPEPDPYFKRTFDDWSRVWWDRVYQYYEKFG